MGIFDTKPDAGTMERAYGRIVQAMTDGNVNIGTAPVNRGDTCIYVQCRRCLRDGIINSRTRKAWICIYCNKEQGEDDAESQEHQG